MDLATVIGVLLGFGAVIAGFHLEGGHLASIVQPTAALIVCGGTLGAVLVQFPLAQVIGAAAGMKKLIIPPGANLAVLSAKLVELAQKARRDGVVSLEAEADEEDDPLLKKALELAVDGLDSRSIRDTMDVALSSMDEHGEGESRVFEAAGGYSPTVGILGAVLGLIHVMQNLSDPAKLGAGIAVAFVGTIYGVGLANLFALPVAGKLKTRHQEAMLKAELIVTGICSIVDGENPRMIERKLAGFTPHAHASARLKEAA
ncbi:MAG: flagellar motor protein [Deltaproteobacteria bacterium]|nr:flagellar motor protein [Deltaproteobacteria bacterium]